MQHADPRLLSMESERAAGLAAGFVSYVTKPISLIGLCEAIARGHEAS